MRRTTRRENREKEDIKSLPVFLLPLILILGLIGGMLGRQTDADPVQTAGEIQVGEIPAEEEALPAADMPEAGTDVSEEPSDAASYMEVHFIDVGQGDATLIICDGHAMLIDGGDNSRGTAVQLYLQSQNITALDYVVATHPDEDHIGGLDVVITKFDCGVILMTDYEKDTATYRDVVDAMAYRGYKKTTPVIGDTYTLGGASFTIVGPTDITGSANDSSVALILQHGENRFYFEGDAEEEEQDIRNTGISLKADVFKLGHHGSRTSNSEEMVEAVDAAYAVLSVGSNSYGHPHAEVLNRLRERGMSVFRTDEQGSIVAGSDGRNITWNCSPTDSWAAGE